MGNREPGHYRRESTRGAGELSAEATRVSRRQGLADGQGLRKWLPSTARNWGLSSTSSSAACPTGSCPTARFGGPGELGERVDELDQPAIRFDQNGAV